MTNFIFSFLPRVESDRSHWIDDDLTEGFPLLFWNDQSSRAPKTERVRDSARPCFFTWDTPGKISCDDQRTYGREFNMAEKYVRLSPAKPFVCGSSRQIMSRDFLEFSRENLEIFSR
jgi:hypothetical protein